MSKRREPPVDPFAASQSKPKESEFEKALDSKSRRRLRARRSEKHSPWFGLGMFGLVGWSIALPTVIGVLIGSWLDKTWPSQISWKITLIFLGVFIGCIIAVHWVKKEIEK